MRAAAVFTFINIFYHTTIVLTENHINDILVNFSSLIISYIYNINHLKFCELLW